ncbi:MAG: ASKHA domain-containing protein [Dehalogenimonas sp.]|uniref:ASKHA domain-containing protein n=1 Tax=Candidatus Dehalogenimonas loeffleri TaxID=3127115 RepID=A0ABZ2J310_9CHLR|nr:ASKHA domain-containing protein [Dehalogenimonas sp.]
MTDKYRILLEPDSLRLTAEHGANLLDVIRHAGVGIAAACGGDGVCGTCKVIIEQGCTGDTRYLNLSQEEIENGVRLACRYEVESDLTVRIPLQSRAPASDGHLRSLSTSEEIMAAENWRFAPPVFKIFLKLTPPALDDNISDLSRLENALLSQGIVDFRIGLAIVKQLPAVLREGDWALTLTLSKESGGLRVTDIQPGDTRVSLYGLAFDIGTTGVRGELLDLIEGRVLAQGVEYNGQAVYGSDVISRIAYAAKTGGLPALQQAVLNTLNNIIRQLTEHGGVPCRDISHVMVAANTTMVQLLLGIDPKYLRLAPYVPAVSAPPTISAGEIGLETGPGVPVNIVPAVSSYVGGDIISGLVGTGIFQRGETVLYIDIGTNGEIVVGNADWMVSASCSAGPAFEGGGIKHGMLATSGAVEGFNIDNAVDEPVINTIGQARPRGICGAGLISTVAALFKAGVIDPKGKFQAGVTERVRIGTDGSEYVLAAANTTETGQDIVLTEIDLDNLIRGKAAMYAGYQTLLSSVGLSFNELDKVVVAGTFGSHIDVECAIAIGLLPDIDRDKFIFAGNGSLLGARLSSYSTELIEAGRITAKLVTNIELSDSASFMDNYMAAMFLPHTDISLFPTVISQPNHFAGGSGG